MADEETVVEEGVSRFGLYRRHIIRWGAPVGNSWVEEIASQARNDIEAVVRYEDEGIGLHHLRVYWREGIASLASLARNDSGGDDE